MNQFLNKLERKFGRYAIPDLIKYVICIYCVGALLGLLNPMVYYNYLCLDVKAVLHGQVWRFVTFLIEPSEWLSGGFSMLGILFFVFKVNIFLMCGRSLEQAWGTFRFNMFFFSGVILNIVAAFIIYFATGMPYLIGIEYIYQAMFFAFAILYPDVQFLIYFIIPIKVKWLAILDGVLMVYGVIQYMRIGAYYMAAAILVAFANFLIFFLSSRNYKRFSPKQVKRRRRFKKQVRASAAGTRHKCVICGRTELDNPDLDFRYCSKCEGNYEYCSDHLFTHEHVKR